MPKHIKEKYPSIADLGGKTWLLRRYAVQSEPQWGATNPSIAYSPKYGYAMMVRSSNYVINERTGELQVQTSGTIRAKVWFADLNDKDLSIKDFRPVHFKAEDPLVTRGIEDAKLFWRDEQWWFTGVMLEKEHTPLARMALYKFDPATCVATFVKKWAGPDVARMEKNWMLPYEQNPNFDFIYSVNGIIKDDKLVASLEDNEDLTGLRGNTNLWSLGDGTYLTVLHTLYLSNSFGRTGMRKYTHQFARLDNYGKIIEISDEFIFDNLDIEFAMGLVEKDGYFVISYGVRDVSSHLAGLPVDTVMGMLNPLDEAEDWPND